MPTPALILVALIALTLDARAAGPAPASDPVPREVTGCVSGGVLKADGYVYSVRVVGGARWRHVDLSAFEGMTIRVGGALLPGDVLHLQRLDVVASECVEGGKYRGWPGRVLRLAVLDPDLS